MLYDTLIALVVVGFIGYLVVTYIPMVEPIKTVVTVGFVLFAILYALRLLSGHGGLQLP